MRVSKTIINFLLVALAFLTILSVTKIVQAQNDARKAINFENVKYELPYPGILPEHPLYIFKMMRDKMWEFLISDLEKKVYFEILMSDKRAAASKVLIEEKNNLDLGISTFTKAYKYLEKTPPIVKALRERNFNTNNIIDKLEGASEKHASLVAKFLERKDLTKQQRDDLMWLLNRYKELFAQVTSLR